MSETELLEFEPLDEAARARLRIEPSVRSPHPVSPLLYGKFCEHLGANIYGGMEAQILYNPTFGELKVQDEFVGRLAEHLGWPDAVAPLQSYRDGAAVGWFRLGSPGDVRLSPDAGPHGCRAQRFETPGAAVQPTGIGQWTALPLHRTRGYEFRLVARSVRPCRLELGLPTLGAVAAVELSGDWRTLTGRIEVPAEAEVDDRGVFLFSLTTAAPANVVVDRVLLYPDDHVGGADPEVLRMLRDARLPILRYPGGNFVSAYRWRDGVGPIDGRPTHPNPVWGGVLETNLFGTDEFVAYCRALGCEPLICVNAGSGTPHEAAEWVQYCNGPADSPMGRLRARHGHAEPHTVRYWEIGNELFGRHQVGWTTPEGYLDRYLRFAEAMRAADPSIRLLACGGLHLGVDAEWNRRLLVGAGAAADCHTHHILEGGAVDATADPEELFHAFMAYPIHVAAEYRLMRQRMLDAGIARPRLAITELQLFAHFRGPRRNGELTPGGMPTNATIAEALHTTLIIHECIRLGELVEMITHSATVNHGGGLRKQRQRTWAHPVHYAHVLGVELAGATPVAVRLACGTFSTAREFGHLPVAAAAPDLDALAALAPDGSLLLMLVHRSAHAGPIELDIDLGGFAAAGPAEVVTLAGEALNDLNTLEQPERVVPRTSSAEVAGGRCAITLVPFSLTRIRFRP